jgi:hypothetical protein
MKKRQSSNVISTRVLTSTEMERVMADIGVVLIGAGYEPQVHTSRLLSYEKASSGKAPVYGGFFLPIKPFAAGVALPVGKGGSKGLKAVVTVTDLPIDFSGESGPPMEVIIGHAFGVSAPDDVRARIEGVLAPFVDTLEHLKAHAADALVGRTFNKVASVVCDNCGLEQEATVPIQISRIEGNTGYGPGGKASVVCSECRKSFDVTWDSVGVQIRWTG